MLHSGKGRGFGHTNRNSAGIGALSAPTLTRTSGVTTYPPTIDFTRPIDWQNGDTALMQRSQDVTFATGVTEVTQTMAGGTVTYNFGLSSVVSGVWYFRMAAWHGTRPANLTWSNIVGVGEAVAPTITSSSSITLSSGVAGTLSLTANEFVTWAITGGVNSDQFTISGSTLTALAQTASGANSVQVTATDPCGNATTQTITATLTLAEFSSASTDKYGSIVLSGTPKLVATGGGGVGSAQNVRLTVAPAASKVVWQVTPSSYVAGDSLYIGAENTSTNFATVGIIVGLSNSNGIAIGFGDWGWEIYHTTGNPQANYNADGVSGGWRFTAGDAVMHEYDTVAGSHAFYRVRSGVKVQIGTTISGLSATFARGFTGMKNGSAMTASLNSFAATPTSGYSNYA